jgi:hypothetical protein
MFEHRTAPGSDSLLALYPGPVTLHPSRLKWVFIFVLMAFWIVCASLLHSLYGPALLSLTGVVAVSLVTLIIIMAITYGRGRPRLTLDADGVEILPPTGGTRRLRWSEITRFRSRLGFFAFHVDARAPEGRWDRFQRAYLGGRYRIWTDTFGLGAARFARLMNGWRERAMAQRH